MSRENFLEYNFEKIYSDELNELIINEKNHVPEGWKMSPQSVLTFIIGGSINKTIITPKYIGEKKVIEQLISTLLSDRELLLIGEPGSGKTMLSSLLSAAICFDSTNVIQCTPSTTIEQITYSFNYPLLITMGPKDESLVKGPLIRSMESGSIIRFEDISKSNEDVIDSLISVMSDKYLSINELKKEIHAKKGFGIIATANSNDVSSNKLSEAILRRFNIVEIPLANLETEIKVLSSVNIDKFVKNENRDNVIKVLKDILE